MTVYGSYFAAFWMGLFAAEIGINIMHDGSHGAFSETNILNTIACWYKIKIYSKKKFLIIIS